MNITAIRRLRRVVLLTVLGLVLAIAGSVMTAGAEVGGKRHPPTLLWKTYPLEGRASARDVTTISRSIGILEAPGTGQQLAGNPAGPRSLAVIVLLGFPMLLLGVAALPQLVFPDSRLADLLARRRTEVTATGAALLLGILIAFALH